MEGIDSGSNATRVCVMEEIDVGSVAEVCVVERLMASIL